MLGLKLVAALGASTGFNGLRVDLLKPLFAKYPAPVQTAGQELITRLNADEAAQAAHLGKLLTEVARRRHPARAGAVLECQGRVFLLP